MSDAASTRTLAKGLSVLAAFGASEPALGNSEIAVRTGLPRTTVARLTKTMATLGYLTYEPRGAKYRLWGGVLKLAHPLLAQMPIRQLARPAMQDFANCVGGTVSLGIRDRLDMIYVETARSGVDVQHNPNIGSSIPLPQAAMGRALWSMLDDQRSAALAGQFRSEAPDVWARFGPRVDQARRDCAERGFCVSRGDWVPHIHAVASPLFTDAAGLSFAVNCGLPAFRLSPGELEADIGPRLVLLAESLRAFVKGRHLMAD